MMYGMTDTPPRVHTVSDTEACWCEPDVFAVRNPVTSHGEDLIKMERWRQVHAKGRTPEHDAEHNDGSLLAAARTYIEYADWQRRYPDYVLTGAEFLGPDDEGNRINWPWADEDFKPSYAVRNLVKAGALIAAEIDRLLAEPDQTEEKS